MAKRWIPVALMMLVGASCGSDSTAGTGTLPKASTAADFAASASTAAPSIFPTTVAPATVMTAGRLVCEHARSGADGRPPINVLIKDNHLNTDDDIGRFAHLAIDRLCPELRSVMSDAIAFDNLMHAAPPPITTPPAAPTPQSPLSPPGASAKCRDGTLIYSEPQPGMCDAHGGTQTLFR